MWLNTRFCKQMQIQLPIIQAPMAGSATTPELVAAVSNAGGLGSIGAGYMSAPEIKKIMREVRQLTEKPFAVNLFIPEPHSATKQEMARARARVMAASAELNFVIPELYPPYAPPFEEQMQIVIDEKAPVFSFTFGVPSDEWITILKRHHIILMGTATSLVEAQLLTNKGIDIIVAQGSEAGGHRGSFLDKSINNLIDLKKLVISLTRECKTPIVAAGGIMNGAGIAEILNLGAVAVQMGTAFLCATESGIHPSYKALLLQSTHDRTVLTRAFSGKIARGLSNKFIMRMQNEEDDILDYPIQNALTSALRKEANKQNDTGFMSMWAGQSHHLCKALSAAEIIQTINDDVLELLNST